MNSKWDTRWLEMATHVSGWSKDPSTQVGAVIVRDGNRMVSLGYNGYPRGVLDSCYHDKEYKYARVVHAEVNAVLEAKGEGDTLYCTHVCCNECAKIICQTNIKKVVYDEGLSADREVQYGVDVTRSMFRERGISLLCGR